MTADALQAGLEWATLDRESLSDSTVHTKHEAYACSTLAETTTSHAHLLDKVRVLRLTGEPVELAVASEATVHELPLGLGINSESLGFGILVGV